MNSSPEQSKPHAQLAHLNSRKFAQCLECETFAMSGTEQRCATVNLLARRHAEQTGHRVMLTTTHFEEYGI